MQDFGVRIVDHLSLLSKNQTRRLKNAVKESFTDKIYRSIDAKLKFQDKLYKEIIPSIQYPKDTEAKYDHAEVQWDEAQRLCTVELLFKERKDDGTRAKIKDILFEKNKMRQSSNDEWKTYAQLKAMSGRKDIPSPRDVKNNSSLYEEAVKNLPNSPFKMYLEKCL